MPKMVISMFVKYIFDDATLLETLALKCRMSQLAVTQRRRHEAEEVRYICERLASDCVRLDMILSSELQNVNI